MPLMFSTHYVSRMPLMFPRFFQIWKHKGHSGIQIALNVSKILIMFRRMLLVKFNACIFVVCSGKAQWDIPGKYGINEVRIFQLSVLPQTHFFLEYTTIVNV